MNDIEALLIEYSKAKRQARFWSAIWAVWMLVGVGLCIGMIGALAYWLLVAIEVI